MLKRELIRFPALLAILSVLVSATLISAFEIPRAAASNPVTAIAADAEISGRVTDSLAAGIEGVCVGAYSLDRWVAGGCTDNLGDYTIAGLTAGLYAVRFGAPWLSDYVTQWWDGANSPATATVIDLAESETLSGIDAVLGEGATVSGSVIDAETSLGIPNVSVTFYSTTDPTEDELSYWAYTNEDGDYSTFGIRPGVYKVLVDPIWANPDFGRVWWGGGDSLESAAELSVGPSDVVTGVGANLSKLVNRFPAAAPVVTVTPQSESTLLVSWTKPASTEPIIGYVLGEDRGWNGDGTNIIGGDSLSYLWSITSVQCLCHDGIN